MESARRAGIPIHALGKEFDKLPISLHCDFLPRTF